MATVTGYTAERMKEIEDSTIINGSVVGDNLILERRDGATINAGDVRGADSTVPGPTGPASIEVVTSSTRPTGGAAFEGLGIYETDTERFYIYDGAAWRYRGGLFFCTSGTRPASPFEGLEIYETNTNRKYIYDGTSWIYVVGGTDPTLVRVSRNTSFSLTVGASVVIPFDTEQSDVSNLHSGGSYTCPTDGWYEVSSRVGVQAPVNERFLIGIHLNGTEIARGTDMGANPAGDTELGLQVHDIIGPCSAGGVIDIRVNQVSGSGRAVGLGASTNRMTVRRVSL